MLNIFVILPTAKGLGQTAPPSAPTKSAATSEYVPTLTFDIASVKLSNVNPALGFNVGGGFNPFDSGNLYLQNCDLYNLLEMAFLIDPNQIEGVERKGRDFGRYSIVAKSEDSTNQKLAKLPEKQLNLEHQHMMQALLTERFHLKTHWDTRRGETYDLIVIKPGKLQSTGVPPSGEELKKFGNQPIPPLYQQGNGKPGYEFIAHGASTGDIAEMLTGQIGKPVTDKTALTGNYDFDLKYHGITEREDEVEDNEFWPPMETEIKDQLGLKLVPSQGPVRVLVIDHIEPLSAN